MSVRISGDQYRVSRVCRVRVKVLWFGSGFRVKVRVRIVLGIRTCASID